MGSLELRTAKAADWWNRVYKKTYSLRIELLRYKNVLGLGNGEICFRGGISALCGENGAGKSTLLSALFHCLSDEALPVNIQRFSDAELTGQLRLSETASTRTTRFNTEGKITEGTSVPVKYLAPGGASQDLITFYNEIINLDELLEAYSPKQLEGSELARRAYVVGRDYDSCEIFEIEDYPDRPVLPYFRVRVGDVTYGSEMMGLGELALHLILWQIERMPNPSVLLLEEPETHIAPRSQAALMHVLAETSVRCDMWVITSTHSAQILGQIPREHVRLLYRVGASAEIIDTPSDIQLHQILGMPTKPAAILLAEDRVAQAFARAWLAFSAPEILQQVLIHIGGAVSDIDLSVRSFPRVDVSFRVIGLYDGDQRHDNTKRPKPCAFLPGRRAPERILKSVTFDVEAAASRLHRKPEELRFALSQLEGLDPHDWLVELGRRLGLEIQEIITGLSRVWLETAEGTYESAEALAVLTEAMNVDLVDLD